MNTVLPFEIGITPASDPAGEVPPAPERPLLSLVIPVRNAAGTLPTTLNSIRAWIADSAMNVEVIVVDDGSSDGTRASASAFERRLATLQVLRHIERKGELEAVRTGEGVATGALIAFGRENEIADSLESCADLLVQVMDGADVVLLPRAADRHRTPVPPARTLSDSCKDWIRRAISRDRDPALLLCRATALRRMMTAVVPLDFEAEPDWVALARRASCAVSVVRRGSASAPARPRPAQTA